MTNSKLKIHQVYKLKSGEIVPGVTTPLNLLGKEALIHWAWQCGVDGVDYRKARDEKGSIGTLVHSMILADLKGMAIYLKDYPDYSNNQLDKAITCLVKYFDWKKGKNIEIIFCEQPLVSEEFRYGGTPDLAAIIEGTPTLVDFKSGRGIYDEYWYQLAAYRQLLSENDFTATRYGIIRIGTDEKQDIEEQWRNNLSREFEIFKHCLGIYNLRKAIKEEK